MKINKCKNETQKCNKEMCLHRIVNVCFLCAALKLSLALLCVMKIYVILNPYIIPYIILCTDN